MNDKWINLQLDDTGPGLTYLPCTAVLQPRTSVQQRTSRMVQDYFEEILQLSLPSHPLPQLEGQ